MDNPLDKIEETFEVQLPPQQTLDGYLDQIEFTQMQDDPAIVKIRKLIKEVKETPLLFNEVDENGDEKISLEELTRTVTPLIPKGF